MRTYISSFSLLCMLLLLPTCADAQEIALTPRDYVLPYGEVGEFAFNPEGEFRSVRLVYTVRMDAPAAYGSTHVMHLSLNGQGIAGGLSRTASRLLNKPLTAEMASGLRIPWSRGAAWRVVYSPDFELVASPQAGNSRILDVSPYRFELDITDLVRRGEENTLKIIHQGRSLNLRQHFPDDDPSLDLVFAELYVELSEDPPAAEPQRLGEPFHADRLMWQPPAACDVMEIVSIDRHGGLAVTLPQMSLSVVSRFSWQGGGFNTFGSVPGASDQEEWSVEVQGDGAQRTIIGTAPEYRVERTLRWEGDHLQVADTLTNLTDEIIGLAFDNTLQAAVEDISLAWVGGNPDPAVPLTRNYENATFFVAGKQAGCGLIALDDVYRAQGVVYYDDGGGIRSETFCLPPQGSYTVRWALYPVQRPEYYDFINLVRRDLDVNFTVPGNFEFGLGNLNDWTDDALRARIEERGLSFISSGVWFDRSGGDVPCYHGSHMLEATELKEQLREAATRLRQVAPGTQSLIYIHAFIDTNPQGPELYADSRILTADGEHYQNPGYTQRIGIPFYYYYPRPGNSYMEAMKRVVDMCLDEDQIGADGIYWDEVEMISVKRTYDTWDGFSAELDENHRIKRTFGDPQLLSMEAKRQLTEYIHEKGGFLIGNSAPMSETMTRLHFPRFVETATDWYPARAHLYTPLSLGDHLTVRDFDSLLADIRLKLMWGSLYYYYARPTQPHPTITRHMFPFTPVQLHRGWLLGEERIITAVPGTFTFGDTEQVRVYWFDAAGKLTEQGGEERVEDGRRLVRLALSDGEMAVIERGD